jgi:hypothetical protein
LVSFVSSITFVVILKTYETPDNMAVNISDRGEERIIWCPMSAWLFWTTKSSWDFIWQVTSHIASIRVPKSLCPPSDWVPWDS